MQPIFGYPQETRRQPFAKKPHPKTQKRNLKVTNMVAVSQNGGHRNRHPFDPGQPWQVPTYTRNAVAAAVEFGVLVKMAVDAHAAITDGQGSFGHVFL
jgi:hypothetical protein